LAAAARHEQRVDLASELVGVLATTVAGLSDEPTDALGRSLEQADYRTPPPADRGVGGSQGVSDDGKVTGPVDFFVSYTSADRPWAEWIARELQHAGRSVVLQAWDVLPGSNFVLQMDEASRVAERTIAVLSPAFVQSPYCRAEWAAAFARDPTGADRRLVPVRVREFEPDGLLGQIGYIDIVGLSQQQAREALLGSVSVDRADPAIPPGFPGLEAGERVRGAAIFNVPVKTRTFVGRERVLEQLADGLADDRPVAATQVHAIHGLGGVGKTQLAARYARLHRDAYDVIWWLRAELPGTLRADLAALAVALGLVDVGVDEPDAVRAACGWLERNGRWLLVFDNVTAPAAIAELVPEGEGGHVLITSRAHADWRALNARPVALDVWEREESHAFLEARAGERDGGVLEKVAVVLGDLPLALEQAAAYTNAKAITLTGYLQRLRDRAPELFAAGRPAGYGHTVATVWSLAFAELAEQPVAAELVLACAHLGADRIPREVLDAYSDLDDDPAVTARVVDDAVELLLSYALLTGSADDTLAMHRLVQDVARTTAGAGTCAAGATRAVTLLDRLMPARSREHEQWPACMRLLEHALSAARYAEEHDVAREQTASVLRAAGHYQHGRGEYATARELLERALAIIEVVHAPGHPAIAGALNDLGILQRQLGEFEAARLTLRRALAIKETVYGAEHQEVATTLGNLGVVEEALGEYEAAGVTQQRALAIKEALYGPEHPELATTLTSIGNVQQHLGAFEDALLTKQRALKITTAVYGPDHPNVADMLTSLGILQQQRGDLEEALVSQQRALAIQEAVYGPEHPDVAMTLGNLGLAQEQLGAYEAALATLCRSLSINEAVYGTRHPEVARTLGNLGNVQQLLGEPEVARVTLQRALELNEAVYGPEHPAVATTLGNLGVVEEQLGELDAAFESQRRALELKEAIYGPEHPDVANTLGNLGIVRQQLGDVEAAREYVGRALAIFERFLGPDHPTTREARAHFRSLRPMWRGRSDAGRTAGASSGWWSRLRRMR
jgi:tetratricopeptide (TPR) repeat protein